MPFDVSNAFYGIKRDKNQFYCYLMLNRLLRNDKKILMRRTNTYIVLLNAISNDCVFHLNRFAVI